MARVRSPSVTIAFAVWRTGTLEMGGRDPTANTAILYLPAVAGSFVTATIAGATLRMIQRGDAGPVSVLAPLLFAVANVTIAMLVVGTIQQWARGRLLSAPSPAPH